MNNSFDVVVVGARCAGAATALLLSRAGARVLMVDKAPYGADTLSTHALMRGAVLQLSRWGLLPRIVAAGTPPVRSTCFGYETRDLTIAIEARHGVEALYAPRRALLDRSLVDAAVESGVDYQPRVQLQDVLRDARGTVTGAILATATGTIELHCALVVGADGLHSTVAKRVAAPTLLAGRHETAVLYSYWTGLDVNGYEWHYRPGASIGAIATNDEATGVFVALPPDRFRREIAGDATAAYHRLLSGVIPGFAARLAGARRVEPVRGFGGHPGFIKRSTGPGWALVGDAGYFKDPLTAHGITDALRDAELLARAVVRGTSAAFAEYEATREELSRGIFEITDAVASFEWSDNDLQALHRSFSAEMSREVRVLAALEPLPCPSPLASAPVVV